MRIAAYQFAVSGNISENYKEIEKAIYIAKTEKVQLLIFPECSLTGYPREIYLMRHVLILILFR